MGTERSQRFSDQLRRRPEIPIALVVLVALLIGVLISTGQQDSADAALQVGDPPGPTTTKVVPTFTYVVTPLLTTTVPPPPPPSTVAPPALTTIPPGGTTVTYPPVTTGNQQTTTTRYVPVTTSPRVTVAPVRPTYTYRTTTTTARATTTTTTTSVPTSSSSSTTSTSTSSTSSTTTSSVPATRQTVLVVGTQDNVERRAALVKALFEAGYNPVEVVSDLGDADGVYYAKGYAASTVGLFDALEAAEPKGDWSTAVPEQAPDNPPWSTDWQVYNYDLVVLIVGPTPT